LGRRASESGVDLSGLLGDFPPVNPAQYVDVGDKRAVFGLADL